MGHKILILDDDTEYNELLRNVFTQAQYEVQAVEEAEEALTLLSDNSFDLILTDHRLPRVTGLEFIQKLREEDRETPIIMVSGFLENETIRDLIRQGVDGLFIKPLNIFSLLKKTGEVIEMHKIRGNQSKKALAGGGERSDQTTTLRSIPGYSEKGRKFLQQLEEHCNFSRNLLLIGSPGMPYQQIAAEVSRTDEEEEALVFLKPGEIEEETISRELEKAIDRNFARITLVILRGEELTAEEQNRIIRLSESETPFENLVVPLRMVFCLRKTVEDLYDQEDIDEDFYLFLGSNELHIPPLAEMPEDLLAIAERELQGHSTDWKLDAQSKTILCRHPWKENIVELRTIMNRAATLSHPIAPSADHIQKAMQEDEDTSGENEPPDRFQRFLQRQRSAYINAFQQLSSS